MITTIQLNESVKKELEKLKQEKETYEDVIVRVINELERQRRLHGDLLIEGCKEMAQDSLRITKEWEATDAILDWEWNENYKRRHSSCKLGASSRIRTRED